MIFGKTFPNVAFCAIRAQGMIRGMEMAKEYTVKTLCDMSEGEVEAAGSRVFSIDGKSYEIDMSQAWLTKFDKGLAPFIAVARKASGKSAGRHLRSVPVSSAREDRDRNKAIRKALKDAGYEVPERGRLSADALKRYAELVESNGAPTPTEPVAAVSVDVSVPEEASEVASAGLPATTKITGLTGSNVDALSHVEGLKILASSSTTATVEGTPNEVAFKIRATHAKMSGRRHPRGSMWAIVKKLETPNSKHVKSIAG